VRPTSLAPQDLHPAAYFGGDAVREGGDALLDGAFDGVALAAGVGGNQGFAGQELKDPADGGAAPAGERPDVGLVDESVRADPGQQDPQRLGPGVPAGGAPAVFASRDSISLPTADRPLRKRLISRKPSTACR
jgi:hypothetical protein